MTDIVVDSLLKCTAGVMECLESADDLQYSSILICYQHRRIAIETKVPLKIGTASDLYIVSA
jgi:hypothetical protein